MLMDISIIGIMHPIIHASAGMATHLHFCAQISSGTPQHLPCRLLSSRTPAPGNGMDKETPVTVKHSTADGQREGGSSCPSCSPSAQRAVIRLPPSSYDSATPAHRFAQARTAYKWHHFIPGLGEPCCCVASTDSGWGPDAGGNRRASEAEAPCLT
jgi:hypothetical protein